MSSQLSSAIAYATADANGVTMSAYAKEMAAWEADQEAADRERDMRRLGFGQRSSCCG